eukprot:scaffold71_cov247-Pinguiococcus_pyrenoidosus.AAC.4
MRNKRPAPSSETNGVSALASSQSTTARMSMSLFGLSSSELVKAAAACSSFWTSCFRRRCSRSSGLTDAYAVMALLKLEMRGELSTLVTVAPGPASLSSSKVKRIGMNRCARLDSAMTSA